MVLLHPAHFPYWAGQLMQWKSFWQSYTQVKSSDANEYLFGQIHLPTEFM